MNNKITASLTLLPLGIVLNSIGVYKIATGEHDLSCAAYCICAFIVFIFYCIYTQERETKYTGGEIQYGNIFMSKFDAVNRDVINGALALSTYSWMVMYGITHWLVGTLSTSILILAILNVYLLGDAIIKKF